MYRVDNIYHFEVDKYIRQKDIVFIDVRSVDEYKKSHIKGAMNIDVIHLEKNISRLAKDKTYIVYCYTGGRSLRAARILNRHGYMVKNVMGGIKNYNGSSLT